VIQGLIRNFRPVIEQRIEQYTQRGRAGAGLLAKAAE
jgi:hypothetical protein